MKKIFIVMIIMLQITSIAVFAEIKDEASSWAKESIENVSNQKILEEDFLSGFGENLTRGECAYLGVKLYEYYTGKVATVGDASFTDVTDEWALKAKNINVLGGYSDGTFLPNRTISREELAVIFVNVLNISDIEYSPSDYTVFADNEAISEWANNAVYIAKANGILSGVGENKFDSQGQATKEEALVIFNRAQNSKELVNYNLVPLSEDSIAMATKVMASMNKTFAKGSFDLSAEASVNIDDDMMNAYFSKNQIEGMSNEVSKQIVKLINNLSVNIDYKLATDLEKYTFDYVMDYNINYKSFPLLSMGAIFNNDVIGFGITNFYDKYFVFDFKSIMNTLYEKDDSLNLSSLDFNKYLKIILESKLNDREKNGSNDAYNKIMMEYFATSIDSSVDESITFDVNGKKITEDVTTYNMNYSTSKYYRMMRRIIKEANTDSTIKTDVQSALIDVVNEIIASKDYVHLNLTEDEMKNALLKISNEFDVLWDEIMVALNDSSVPYYSNGADYASSTQMVYEFYDNMDTKISINAENTLRSVNVDVENEGVKINVKYVVNAVGSDVVIESKEDKYIKISDYVDYSNNVTLKNKEKLAGLIREGLLSSIKELGEGKAYILLIEDLKPLEEAMGIPVSMYDSYLQRMKSSVEIMTDEEIIETFGLSTEE